MPAEDTTPKPNLLPTVEGYVTGIVCLDPFTLQCGECGSTVTAGTERGAKNHLVQFSGYLFHRDWPANNCVAWLTKANRRCGRTRAAGYLCSRHHAAALADYQGRIASQARAAALRTVDGAA